jgi:soluble lytic murein transglycosylase-like protein
MEAAERLSARVGLVLSIDGHRLSAPELLSVRDEVIAAAGMHGIDPLLILALMKAESDFDPRAVSRKGAVGLLQLQPVTARWFADRIGAPWEADLPLFDVGANVRLGVGYLAYLHSKFAELEPTLEAYRSGPNARAVRRQRGSAFARKVLSTYRRYWKLSTCHRPGCGSQESASAEVAKLCEESGQICQVL